jgi:glycosyltransferase involved in cell wall biosynthesis
MNISVVIPTYNRSDFVVQAVRSVIQQSFKPSQIIVVDDGSTDNTRKKIQQNFGSDITYIYIKARNVSAARNVGIRNATGNWIAFLDSDDLWKPTKLYSQQQYVQQHPDYKVCYTDEEWRKNGRWMNQKKIHAKYSGWVFDQCLPRCIISPSSVLIERTVFDKIGFFDENLPACEDYDFWLRVTLHYPVLFIPQKLIVKRAGDWDQLSKQHSLDKYRIIALEKIFHRLGRDEILYEKTKAMLKKKCKIYSTGCRKHDRLDEAEWATQLANKYQ